MRSHLSAKHAKEVPTEKDAAQPAITNFTSRPRRCDDRRAGDITALITNMIVKDMLPISFVEGGGFLEFMASLEPDYRVPGRTTMTKRIEKLYKDKAEDLRRSLSTVSKVSITTDGWTALTTESYVTITCHYIDSEWEMKSAVLQTRATPEQHMAENLAEGLRSATESWGILEKVKNNQAMKAIT
ncbi:putative AC9 transposase [Dissostichus eleginoides]|uniref:AC9 transposase n=2 Tax=Dissostichus eleginoides TaxID=100907 RepID=A0AAD9FJ20_DISEL|nr:putative AC9 transposase [Dissostichus eleginoides]